MKQLPTESSSYERTVLEARLLRPDWEFYERHLQRPAPAALRELFADRDLVTIVGPKYEGTNGISTFNPLDKDSLVDVASLIGHDIIAIAVSNCGDAIYLRPGTAEPDAVYIAYHDDLEDVEVFAESVAVMLEKLRKQN